MTENYFPVQNCLKFSNVTTFLTFSISGAVQNSEKLVLPWCATAWGWLDRFHRIRHSSSCSKRNYTLNRCWRPQQFGFVNGNGRGIVDQNAAILKTSFSPLERFRSETFVGSNLVNHVSDLELFEIGRCSRWSSNSLPNLVIRSASVLTLHPPGQGVVSEQVGWDSRVIYHCTNGAILKKRVNSGFLPVFS